VDAPSQCPCSRPSHDGTDDLNIQLVQSAAEWLRFVEQHPRGSVFHTPEMIQTFTATRGHEVLALEARCHDTIVAVLVAVRIATVGGMVSRFALGRFCMRNPSATIRQPAKRGLKRSCESTIDG
jgi:hypothetical protein